MRGADCNKCYIEIEWNKIWLDVRLMWGTSVTDNLVFFLKLQLNSKIRKKCPIFLLIMAKVKKGQNAWVLNGHPS